MSAFRSPSMSPTPASFRLCAGTVRMYPLVGLDGKAVHRIEIVLTSAEIPPQDVRLTISIQVAGSNDVPTHIGKSAGVAFGGFDRERVHRPDIVLAGSWLCFADELSAGVIVKGAIAQGVGLPDSLAERVHLVSRDAEAAGGLYHAPACVVGVGVVAIGGGGAVVVEDEAAHRPARRGDRG